jgi:hypothetical protein
MKKLITALLILTVFMVFCALFAGCEKCCDIDEVMPHY